jgi:hypothetical protein
LLSPGLLALSALDDGVDTAGVGTLGVAAGTLLLRTAPLDVVGVSAWSKSRLELLKKGDCSAI